MTSSAAENDLFDQMPYGQTVKADEITDTLTLLDDWEDRYRYIIELGQALPVLPDDLRRQEYLVQGCQSQVWLMAESSGAASGNLRFIADSDALIVRGLIAMVFAVLNNQPPSEIVSHNIEDYFETLALLSHLSQARGNGLRAMVAKIRWIAQMHNPSP